jgi:hypothetical protein
VNQVGPVVISDLPLTSELAALSCVQLGGFNLQSVTNATELHPELINLRLWKLLWLAHHNDCRERIPRTIAHGLRVRKGMSYQVSKIDAQSKGLWCK